MNVLVLGASGATGKLVVDQLARENIATTAIVRNANSVAELWKQHSNLKIIEDSILNISNERLKTIVLNCDAVVSCLGHNLSFKGIYGQPRLLVTHAVQNICSAIKENASATKTKFILMNTSGNRNKDLNEQISTGEKIVIALLRALLPPHVDNEKAAEYLRSSIGQDDSTIEWVAVRPDGLIDNKNVTEYDVYPSPIRSAIFNAGKTSRINVANFMKELLTKPNLWDKWKGQMPIIYNSEQ